MTAKELRRIFQKGECLSLDTMRLYTAGKLPKKSMHEVEMHLIECGLCSTAMDGLTPRRLSDIDSVNSRIQRRLAVYMNTPPRLPFFRRFGFAIGSAVVLIAGGISLAFLLNSSGKTGAQIISKTTPDPATFSTDHNSGQVIGDNAVNQPGASSFSTQNSSSSNNPNITSSASQKRQTLADVPADQQAKTASSQSKQDDQIQVNAISNSASSSSADQPPASGSSTRSASTNSVNAPVRIKNVVIYPPVSHNDNSSRHGSSKAGQLSRSSGSSASFELDQMPSYVGGDEALRDYLLSSFHPVNADRSAIKQYATGVMFIVNSKTGVISAPQLSLSISPDIDAEILRVVQDMPQWNPGKKRGEVDVMIGITLE